MTGYYLYDSSDPGDSSVNRPSAYGPPPPGYPSAPSEAPSYGAQGPGYGAQGSSYGAQGVSYGTHGASAEAPSYGGAPVYGLGRPDYGAEQPSYDPGHGAERPSYGAQGAGRPSYNAEVSSYGGERPSHASRPERPGRPSYEADRPSYGAERPDYGAGRPSYGQTPEPGRYYPNPTTLGQEDQERPQGVGVNRPYGSGSGQTYGGYQAAGPEEERRPNESGGVYGGVPYYAAGSSGGGYAAAPGHTNPTNHGVTPGSQFTHNTESLYTIRCKDNINFAVSIDPRNPRGGLKLKNVDESDPNQLWKVQFAKDLEEEKWPIVTLVNVASGKAAASSENKEPVVLGDPARWKWTLGKDEGGHFHAIRAAGHKHHNWDAWGGKAENNAAVGLHHWLETDNQIWGFFPQGSQSPVTPWEGVPDLANLMQSLHVSSESSHAKPNIVGAIMGIFKK